MHTWYLGTPFYIDIYHTFFLFNWLFPVSYSNGFHLQNTCLPFCQSALIRVDPKSTCHYWSAMHPSFFKQHKATSFNIIDFIYNHTLDVQSDNWPSRFYPSQHEFFSSLRTILVISKEWPRCTDEEVSDCAITPQIKASVVSIVIIMYY